MSKFTILYDHPQEANWFRGLHPAFRDVDEESITDAQARSNGEGRYPELQLPVRRVREGMITSTESKQKLAQVFSYDRPDIVLLDGDEPILVVEETVEVPSGHNVGQRFARIAAAAESGVPCLYYGPYVAKKHGGDTAGPRFVNVRLFHAIDAMIRATQVAVTTINWPVDRHHEVRRDRSKDKDSGVLEYISFFLDAYSSRGMRGVNDVLLKSAIHLRMLAERDAFVSNRIRNPEQYDGPPPSVEIISPANFAKRFRHDIGRLLPGRREIVFYKVGMRGIRSDPYVGMMILYKYLYLVEEPSRALVLWFPHITEATWRAVARSSRKDVRLFRRFADAILFSDTLVVRANL